MLKILWSLLFIAPLITSANPKQKSPLIPSSQIPEKRVFEINTEINPCQDFHKYVCSKAESQFKLREDRSRHLFAFSDSRERLLETQMKFMKELPKKKKLDPRTQQVRELYLSCMNVKKKTQQEKSEVQILTKEVADLKSTEEFIRYVNLHLPTHFGGFVSLWASNNLDDSDKMDAVLYSNLMNLPEQKYYEQEELIKDYEKTLVLFLQSIEPKLSQNAATERAQNLIALEKDFAKTFPLPAVRRQRWGEKRVSSQEDLIKKYPNLKLELILKHAPKELLVNTPIPESLEFLNSKITEYPLTVWKDLYLLRGLSDLMDDAYPKYFKSQFDLEKNYFGGPTVRPSREERCTSMANRPFSKEIDAALIDQVFPNFDEKKVYAVAEKIRESIVEGLKKNTWLSKDGKNEALAKISTARLQLVKPQNELEWDFLPLKKYFPRQYMRNLHTLHEARWEKTLQELKEPANKDSWGMSPLTVNAYYSSSENKFVLPIGILQYPFYNKDGSVIENLGAVGAVVGHELGHSIDDNGSKYDSQGRLKQWMTTKDIMEFNKRGLRMIEQFNKAEHDGKLTLGENVADLVGLTFAYNAAFPNGKGEDKDKKDFFLAYGRLWCEVIRPDNAQLLRKTDPHSSGKARINEQVKQQAAFAETFQCKAGDKMTLPDTERVKIW